MLASYQNAATTIAKIPKTIGQLELMVMVFLMQHECQNAAAASAANWPRNVAFLANACGSVVAGGPICARSRRYCPAAPIFALPGRRANPARRADSRRAAHRK